MKKKPKKAPKSKAPKGEGMQALKDAMMSRKSKRR